MQYGSAEDLIDCIGPLLHFSYHMSQDPRIRRSSVVAEHADDLPVYTPRMVREVMEHYFPAGQQEELYTSFLDERAGGVEPEHFLEIDVVEFFCNNAAMLLPGRVAELEEIIAEDNGELDIDVLGNDTEN